MWIINNASLDLADMKNNAQEFYAYMKALGFNKWSIFAMLGNIQTESTINPGRWEIGHTGDTRYGFGLTQWTPATKIIEWQESHGVDKSNPEGQMNRIAWERDNHVQWYPTSRYPYSFREFADWQVAEGEEETELRKLADMFLKNYERPKNQNQPSRGTQAIFWWRYLESVDPDDPTPPEPPPDPPPEPDPDPEPIPPNYVRWLWRDEKTGLFVGFNDEMVQVKIYYHTILRNEFMLVLEGVPFYKICENLYRRNDPLYED